MDPISHVLLARAMSRTSPVSPDVPGRSLAFALGSLAPDVDLLVAPFGWDRYLAVHEASLHSLVWSPLLALAVAGIVQQFAKRTGVRRLVAPAWLGIVAGHLLFDLVSGSDMRVLSPLWSARWGPHWLTMADGLAIVVLVAGTAGGFWRRRLAAWATIVALLALVLVKSVSQQWAMQVFERHNGPVSSHPEAVGGSLWRWTFFDRQGDRVRVWGVNAWSASVEALFTRADAAADPLVSSTRDVTVVRRLLALAHDPFARIETGADGKRLVLWSDIRYCSEAQCDLSFGVEVDGAGRMLRQLSRIGPVSQWRALR